MGSGLEVNPQRGERKHENADRQRCKESCGRHEKLLKRLNRKEGERRHNAGGVRHHRQGKYDGAHKERSDGATHRRAQSASSSRTAKNAVDKSFIRALLQIGLRKKISDRAIGLAIQANLVILQ